MREEFDGDLNSTLFSVGEIWSAVTMLGDRGISVQEPLDACGLSFRGLLDPSEKVTFAQLAAVYRRAKPHLTAKDLASIGARQHLTAFGIVGFAMLSSRTLEDALEVSARFWPMVNAKFRLDIQIRGPMARLSLLPRFTVPEDIRSEFVSLELQKIRIFLIDLLGADCRPDRIAVESEAVQRLVDAWADCPIERGNGNWVNLPAHLLRRPLLQAHEITHSASIEECHRVLGTLHRLPALVQRVWQQFSRLDVEVPSLNEIATRLHMSERTLRRRLQDLGTSYSQVLEDVRFAMAKKHLSEAGVTTDRIAEKLGYTETANFRHAFKRWTGLPPQTFRQREFGL